MTTPDRQTDWRPIETAPRDGDEVLLGWNGDVQIGWWERSRGHFSWHEASSPRTMQPTHWRPLPEPPSDDALGGDEGEAGVNPKTAAPSRLEEGEAVALPFATFKALHDAYPGDPRLIGLSEDVRIAAAANPVRAVGWEEVADTVMSAMRKYRSASPNRRAEYGPMIATEATAAILALFAPVVGGGNGRRS